MLIRIAQIVAERATCGRKSVGAVIAREGRILSTGYNGPAAGMPHCSSDTCTFTQPCVRSIHAEANAIAFAAKNGVSLEGSTLYLTLSPCVSCAQLIANSGIERVVFEHRYRDTAGFLWLIKNSKVAVFQRWDEKTCPIIRISGPNINENWLRVDQVE